MTNEQIAAEVKSIGDNLTQVLANSANAKTDATEAKSVVTKIKLRQYTYIFVRRLKMME